MEMKVSEASNDELSQFIAPFLGYRKGEYGDCDGMNDAWFDPNGVFITSELDFCTTGDGMKAMMERSNLLAVFYSGIADQWVVMKTIVVNAGEVLPKGQWFVKAEVIGERLSINKDLYRAVAEGFALMNGWKE